MTAEIDINITDGPTLVLPVPVTSVDITLLTGRGRLVGWSLRDATNDAQGETSGSVTSPTAGQTIVTTPALPGGTIQIGWTVSLQGTVAAADANNFEILHNAGVIATSENAGAVGVYPQLPFEVVTVAGDTISIKAVAAGTVGAVYGATVAVQADDTPTAVVELQDGGNSIGESAPSPGGVDTQNFGVDGIKIVNQIKLHIVSGIVTGAVYASYRH